MFTSLSLVPSLVTALPTRGREKPMAVRLLTNFCSRSDRARYGSNSDGLHKSGLLDSQDPGFRVGSGWYGFHNFKQKNYIQDICFSEVKAPVNLCRLVQSR